MALELTLEKYGKIFLDCVNDIVNNFYLFWEFRSVLRIPGKSKKEIKPLVSFYHSFSNTNTLT